MKRLLTTLIAAVIGMSGFCKPINSMLASKGMEMESEQSFVNPYITDGLIAMWDGEWNAGWGKHDADAMAWQELVSGKNFYFVNAPTWQDMVFISGESWIKFYASDVDGLIEAYNNGDFTFQFVLDYDNTLYPTTQFPMFFGTKADSLRLYCRSTGRAGGWWYSSGYAYDRPLTTKCATYSAQENSKFRYYDGTTVHVYASSTTVRGPVMANSPFYIGRADYNAGDNTRYIGPICCIRLYNRQLTSDEIAHNYSIDKVRFNLP